MLLFAQMQGSNALSGFFNHRDGSFFSVEQRCVHVRRVFIWFPEKVIRSR